MSPKWVGQFRELSGDISHASIDGAVGAMSETEAMVVARYLRSGLELIDVMEVSRDVLDGAAIVESASVLGDGRWIWREDLAHYVEKYRVALDPEFLNSIVRHIEVPCDEKLRGIVGDAMRLWQGP